MKQCRDLIGEFTPRRLPCSHFNDSAANTPDVRLSSVPHLLNNLRGHPQWCALDRDEKDATQHSNPPYLDAAHREVPILETFDRLARAKVGELNGARVVHQDVSTLDVAVHCSPIMRRTYVSQ